MYAANFYSNHSLVFVYCVYVYVFVCVYVCVRVCVCVLCAMCVYVLYVCMCDVRGTAYASFALLHERTVLETGSFYVLIAPTQYLSLPTSLPYVSVHSVII